MSKFQLLVSLAVFFNTLLVNSEQYFLVCPSGYKAHGQAWYAETPNNIQTDVVKPSDVDFTEQLTSPSSHYNPETFSACVICDNSQSTHGATIEVEICTGDASLRKDNLAYERRTCSRGDSSGTLVWCNAANPIGLVVDMSKKDLLSTLQSMEAITDSSSSFQSDYLACPDGFQLDSFEERCNIDIDSYQRRCIICSGSSLKSSSCVARLQTFDNPSFLLPTLPIVDSKCPWGSNSESETCQLDVKKRLKGNQSPCGLLVNPYQFLYYYTNLNIKDLNFDCLNKELQSKET